MGERTFFQRNLGGNAILTPQQTAFQALLQFRPDTGDRVELGVTLAFGLTPVPLAGAYPPFVALPREYTVRGKVSWGVGAGIITAEFDIRQGTMLTLPATSITAEAMMVDSSLLVSPPKVRVDCVLASGPGPGRALVVITNQPISLAPAALKIVPVPAFARAVQLYADVPAWYASASRVVQLGGPAITDRIFLETGPAPYLVALAGNPDGVVLSGKTHFLAVSNGMVGSGVDITPIWTLDL